jgi:hypothetical protein
MWRLISLITLAAVGACSSSYQSESLSGTEVVQLDRAGKVMIAIPADGEYGSKKYPGSGQTVADAIAAAFSARAPQVVFAPASLTQEQLLDSARKAGFTYVATSIITHWEQRETEWSGKPSKMAIRLSVFAVPTGAQVAATSITGESATFTLSSTRPEELLADPIKKYVNALYGVH